MLKIIAFHPCPLRHALYIFGVKSADGDDTIYVRHIANRGQYTPRWTTAYDCWSSGEVPNAGIGISEQKRNSLENVCGVLIECDRGSTGYHYQPGQYLLHRFDVFLSGDNPILEKEYNISRFNNCVMTPWGQYVDLGGITEVEARFATLLQMNVLRGIPEWLNLIDLPR